MAATSTNNVKEVILNLARLCAHQIMVTYPVNCTFSCLGNDCSSLSAAFNEHHGKFFMYNNALNVLLIEKYLLKS